MRRLLLALALLTSTAAPAAASPRWLDAELPFGDAPSLSDRASAAMAPDGTVIVARFAPDGALEVRERPPGGTFGATTTLPQGEQEPRELEVLTAADGTAALVFAARDLRFAALRKPGGRWTRPVEAGPAGSPAVPRGPVALAPDGALWSIGRAPAGNGRLAAYRLAGDGPPSFTPLPRSGGNQVMSGISVPRGDVAHVVYTEGIGPALEDGRCVSRTKLFGVDISADGEPGPVQTLDEAVLRGNPPAEICFPTDGAAVSGPLLIASDADGASTIVWPRITFPGFGRTTLARHREPGGPWAVAGPPEDLGRDSFALRLLGGTGDPLLVARSEFGHVIATRAAGGRWSAFRPVVPDVPFQVVRTGTGSAAFAWLGETGVVGRVLDRAGRLGDAATIAPASPEAALLALGADAAGDAVALTSDRRGDAFELRTNGYDDAGPRVTSLTLPQRPAAGVSALFAAEGLDVWSGPARGATWDFGDGAVEDGLSRPHAYASAGRRSVEVRLRDAVGNETSAAAPLDVAGAPAAPGPVVVPTTPPPPPRDVRAPRLTRVSTVPARPVVKFPVSLELTTDEGGRLRVVLTKEARGVRRGGRCVASRRGRGRTCTRTLARRTLTRTVAAGAREVKLPRLSAGRWRIRATVTDAAGNTSRARVLRVKVSGAAPYPSAT